MRPPRANCELGNDGRPRGANATDLAPRLQIASVAKPGRALSPRAPQRQMVRTSHASGAAGKGNVQVFPNISHRQRQSHALIYRHASLMKTVKNPARFIEKTVAEHGFPNASMNCLHIWSYFFCPPYTFFKMNFSTNSCHSEAMTRVGTPKPTKL